MFNCCLKIEVHAFVRMHVCVCVFCKYKCDVFVYMYVCMYVGR